MKELIKIYTGYWEHRTSFPCKKPLLEISTAQAIDIVVMNHILKLIPQKIINEQADKINPHCSYSYAHAVFNELWRRKVKPSEILMLIEKETSNK